MPFERRAFLLSHGITAYDTSGEELRIDCPFCGEETGKAFWNDSKGLFCCHKCGQTGNDITVVAELAGISNSEAYRLIGGSARGAVAGPYKRPPPVPPVEVADVPIELPRGFMPFNLKRTGEAAVYWDYVTKIRRISPATAIKYGLGYTKFGQRVVIPVKVGGRLVNWIGRDITGAASIKVLTPSGNHQSRYLMNWDRVKENSSIVLVEGPFDCLRIPEMAAATFGKRLHRSQADLLLAARPEEVVIAFDADALVSAFGTARMLVQEIPSVRIAVFPAGEDPGSLSYEETLAVIRDARPYSAALEARAKLGRI